MIAKKSKPAAEIKVNNKNRLNGNGSNGKMNGKLKEKLTGKLFNRTELDTKIKLARERAENTVYLGFEKAIAHYENPSMYPLPSDNKSVEKVFYNLLQTLSKNKRKKIQDKINETLKASTTARKNKYKDIVNVNFKSAIPIAEQVKAMPVPDELIFTEEEGNELTAEFKRKAEKPKKTGYPTSKPQQAAPVKKISFFVDNMTCLNPDDVRKDEINLAGFAIDTAGNNAEISPFFVGKFRKNETVLLGGKSKLFTLENDPNQIAQTFVAGLFIIENDLISNQDTLVKLSRLFIAIGLAISLIGLALCIISAFVVPIITPAIAYLIFTIAMTFNVIGIQIIPLMGDDISFAATDTLAFDGLLNEGTTFDRTLTIGKGFDINSTFDGKYTAAARWVAEA